MSDTMNDTKIVTVHNNGVNRTLPPGVPIGVAAYYAGAPCVIADSVGWDVNIVGFTVTDNMVVRGRQEPGDTSGGLTRVPIQTSGICLCRVVGPLTSGQVVGVRGWQGDGINLSGEPYLSGNYLSPVGRVLQHVDAADAGGRAPIVQLAKVRLWDTADIPMGAASSYQNSTSGSMLEVGVTAVHDDYVEGYINGRIEKIAKPPSLRCFAWKPGWHPSRGVMGRPLFNDAGTTWNYAHRYISADVRWRITGTTGGSLLNGLNRVRYVDPPVPPDPDPVEGVGGATVGSMGYIVSKEAIWPPYRWVPEDIPAPGPASLGRAGDVVVARIPGGVAVHDDNGNPLGCFYQDMNADGRRWEDVNIAGRSALGIDTVLTDGSVMAVLSWGEQGNDQTMGGGGAAWLST